MADAIQKAVGKVAKIIEDTVNAEVVARVRKYKVSNDALRKELDGAKQKVAGIEAEFKPQVKRAQDAEKRVSELEVRVNELNLTVQALQAQNAQLQVEAAASKRA